MELRQLRYFLAVAETLNFTRAAERLGMAQPPLSQQIRKLEASLGTPLFHRDRRSVTLTEAGEQFRGDVQRVLADLEAARGQALATAAGKGGRLSVGFAGSAVFHPGVAQLMRTYRHRYPGVQIDPVESNTPTLAASINNFELDCALVRLPFDLDHGRYRYEVLVEEDMRLVLPPGHALADRDDIALSELSNDALILFPRSLGPKLYDSILLKCQAAGVTPRLAQQSPQISSSINMVAAGFGVAIVPESIASVHAPGVSYHRLTGRPLVSGIALVCRAEEARPAVANLMAACKAIREAL
ncbi:LysR family transcriptional regulator [Larsenimonas salina]|uniref:LysR family transcriptional regulator n=1 Tax=Larsenimonas salina TaxID=1295565 RepID=UPI002072B4CD|nr:LysR family transcriptional regulator [Larsenimonas salina]MCM5704918.1 LysR family transcriptional regulator [Larsenimonas salina]